MMDGIVLFRLHTIFGVPLKQNPGVLNTPLTLSLPLPALLGDPYPHWRVGFFEGKGKGTPILPGGYPCQTLTTRESRLIDEQCIAMPGTLHTLHSWDATSTYH